MLRQFAVTARSIHSAANAAGDVHRAAQVNGALRERLRQVRETYPIAERSHLLQQSSPEQQATSTRAETPTPASAPSRPRFTLQVEIPTTRSTSQATRGRDHER